MKKLSVGIMAVAMSVSMFAGTTFASGYGQQKNWVESSFKQYAVSHSDYGNIDVKSIKAKVTDTEIVLTASGDNLEDVSDILLMFGEVFPNPGNHLDGKEIIGGGVDYNTGTLHLYFK